MKRICLTTLVALACLTQPVRAEEGIITYKSLAPDVAIDMAKAALHKCRNDGYQVAVVVLDRFALPLVTMRDRFTPAGAIPIASGKAWTAVTFTRDTGEFVKALKDGAISAGLTNQPGVTPLVGGMVIQAGGSLLGGIGVAGAPGGDLDEACAKAGLESVRDKLEF